MAVPSFPIVRQVLIANVLPDMRRTALALDSALTEVAYMAGPLIGVWAATTFDTRPRLPALEWASLLGALALWYLNPPLRRDDSEAAGASVGSALDDGAGGRRPRGRRCDDVHPRWCRRRGRGGPARGTPSAIGWVLAGWGARPMVGGLLYGAWHRAVPVFWLLLALGALTILVAWTTSLPAFAGLLLVGGALVAPSITATVDTLSRVVPSTAMGRRWLAWHRLHRGYRGRSPGRRLLSSTISVGRPVRRDRVGGRSRRCARAAGGTDAAAAPAPCLTRSAARRERPSFVARRL